MIIDLTYPMHQGMFTYPSDIAAEIDITPAHCEKPGQLIYDEGGKPIGTIPFVKNSGLKSEACRVLDHYKNAFSYSGLKPQSVRKEHFCDVKYKSGHTKLTITNHHGTHIDAPAHKIPYGKTIDQYPIEKFINNCGLVDLTETDLLRRDRRMITPEAIQENFNPIGFQDLRALIVYAGFCDEIRANEGRLTGEAKKEFEKTFPYFSQEAAHYLLSIMPDLNILGIDSFAVDPQGSNSEVHRIFFSRNILPLETLVNLKELKRNIKKTFFRLNSVPLNYQNADASQARAFAEVF